MITVYSTPTCPRCEALKAKLQVWERPYQEARMVEDLLQDAELMTDILMTGKSFRSAPVLRVGNSYIGSEELFRGGEIDEEKLRELV